jgi:hypothetical protein
VTVDKITKLNLVTNPKRIVRMVMQNRTAILAQLLAGSIPEGASYQQPVIGMWEVAGMERETGVR